MVAELSRKLLREIDAGNETREGRLKRLEFVRASSQILDLSFEAAVMAGELDVEMKRRAKGWGIADSIYSSQAMRETVTARLPYEMVRRVDAAVKRDFSKP